MLAFQCLRNNNIFFLNFKALYKDYQHNLCRLYKVKFYLFIFKDSFIFIYIIIYMGHTKFFIKLHTFTYLVFLIIN